MPIYLLLATTVIIACIICNKVSSKLGIPMLLAFILLGMFFGSDGVIKIYFDNFDFAQQICSVALIFIMFYGGFCANWSAAKPIAIKAILLSSVGVVLTAALTGLFCYYVLRIGLLESFLIGSVISSTDAASVFSILRSKKLNLKYHTASLLEVESGSNDPCSYMLTVLMLSLMSGTVNGPRLTYMIFAQIVYAILFAIGISALALYVLKKFTFATEGFDSIFVLAVAILAYAAPEAVGGNGYLSTYIVGIIIGNRPIKNKKSLVNFFDGITGLMQMLIFFLLGLLSFPSKIPTVVVPALLIALFLTFVARPATIFALLTPFGCKLNQQLLISWAGLRGAASIVFAIMVTTSTATVQNDIFHIIFCIVLFSILFQGALLPYASRKLNMIDETANVMKTFTDYTEEMPIQFIQVAVHKKHPWVEKMVREVTLPPDTLLVLLQRQDMLITPKGSTVLEEGDILILSAKTATVVEGVNLSEIELKDESDWVGKTVSEIPLESDKIIVMVQRRGHIVIPKGSTVLKEKDILVINQSCLV